VACPEINYSDSYAEDGKGFVQIEFEWYFTEEVDA
jgi:hypothetical protein